jgi:hypothetical protein
MITVMTMKPSVITSVTPDLVSSGLNKAEI